MSQPAPTPIQQEAAVVQQENAVFRDAYQKGLISQEQYNAAMAYQSGRVSDTTAPAETELTQWTKDYQESQAFYSEAGYPQYGGAFAVPTVPEGYQVAKIEETPAASGAKTLNISFIKPAEPTPTPTALESALSKYFAEPKIVYSPSGRAGTRTDMSSFMTFEQQQAARWANYTPEERTALEGYLAAERNQKILSLAMTITAPISFVVAPIPATIGAISSPLISQGIKGFQGGGLLTPQEVYESATMGATFSAVGSGVMGQVAKAVPILTQPTISGAVSRVTASTIIGGTGGGAIGAGEAALRGGDILEGAKTGALYGTALGFTFGVGGEVYGAAKPWIGRQYNRVANTLSPERAMYNRVVLGQEAQAAATGSSITTKLQEAFNPTEAAMYRRVTGVSSQPTQITPTDITTPKTTWTQRITTAISPEKALYSRVTGTSPKPSSSTFTGGEFKPFYSSGGKGGLSSVLVVKQAPALKAPMKPMPVQLAAWETQLTKTEVAPIPKIEPLSLKTEVTAFAPKTIQKTTPTTPTTVITAYDPTVYQGTPYLGTRRRQKTEYDQTVLSYPESGLSHPPKLSEQIENAMSQFETGRTRQEVGTIAFQIPSSLSAFAPKQTQQLPKPSTIVTPKSFVGVTPIFDIGQVPKVDTSTVTDTIQRTVQEQGQITTQFSTSKTLTRGIPRGMFEISVPEGFGRRSPLSLRGAGRQKRLYPIVTGEQVLKSIYGKSRQKKSTHKGAKRRK